MKTNLLFLLGLSFGWAPCMAQPEATTVIKGMVVDSTTQAPLEFATVSVQAAGGKNVGTTLTKEDGRFELRNIPVTAGALTLTVSFIGYRPSARAVRTASAGTWDAGVVALKTSSVRLDEIVVSGAANEMVVRKDTIEYNAAAFKVTQGATVEELLKKLPGAEIDSDGKITVAGQEIKKVLLDGKTFFSDDPQIATKNLPANMVDRVQVVNRKSDQAQFTGIDDGNEETVLNLTILPGMKNGWFGNVMAGAGYENRYQAGGMVSNLKDDRQLSIIASGNNTNNRGFNDITGNMMQQGRGGSGGGSMRTGGGGQGGGYNMNVGGARMSIGGNGLTTSWLGGVNAHDEWTNLKLGGNYFYNGAETAQNTDTYRQNIFSNDSVSYHNQSQRSVSRTDGHRAAAELEWTLDSLNSIVFKPNVSYGLGNFSEQSNYSTLDAGRDTVNSGYSSATGDNQSLSFNGDLLLRHKFKTAGRTVSANLNFGYSTNATDGNNYSLTRLAAGQDTIDQQYRSNNLSYTGGLRLSYTEPLGNNYFAELAYNVRANYSTSDKETYNLLPGAGYTALDSAYTNHYRNLFVNQQAEVNLRSIREKYQWTVGVNMQPSYLRSEGRTEDGFERSVINFSPNGNFTYNFSNSHQLRADYRGRTTQPSISQLQPVPDNSNPLLERMGNAGLSPEFNNNLRIFYRNTNPQTLRTIVSMLNASLTTDKIVNNTIYESTTGKQLIIPVNVDNVYSLMGMFMFSAPLKPASKFVLTSNTSANFLQNLNLTQTVSVIDPERLNDILNNGVENKTRTFSLNEMLRFGYKGTKIDINLMGRAGYSKAWVSLDEKEQPAYWTNSVGGDFNWTLPWDLALASDANYTYYIGYADGYNKPVFVWNAELSKLLFKQKQGTLKVRVFDLLNEGRGNNRTITDNYIEDTLVNTLGRYVMCSFTYRFGSFGNNRRSSFMRPDGAPGGRRERTGM